MHWLHFGRFLLVFHVFAMHQFLELIFEMCLVYLQYKNLLELEMIYNVFHVFVVHQSIGIDQQCMWFICNALSIGIQMCQLKPYKIDLELLKCPWITSCILYDFKHYWIQEHYPVHHHLQCVFCNGESFFDPFEKLSKAIAGSIMAWSFMNAWHIVVFRFNITLTMLLILLWTFLSFYLKYYICSLKVWLWNLECCSLISSLVTSILSITSTITLLIC